MSKPEFVYHKATISRISERMTEDETGELSCNGDITDHGVVLTLTDTSIYKLVKKVEAELYPFDSGQWNVCDGKLECSSIETELMVPRGQQFTTWTEINTVTFTSVYETPIDAAQLEIARVIGC